MRKLSSLASLTKRIPLHPQWLLGRRVVPAGIAAVSGRILDIGAADKWLEKHLSGRVSYFSLDLPATGGDMYGSRPDVFADGAALPFQDEVFDAVACLEVLEHTPDPASVLAEIRRVLKPGAEAWISMPFLYPIHDAPFDFQRFTEFGLHRSLERAGLSVIAMGRTLHPVECAGLLMSLAIAGPLREKRGVGLLLGLLIALPLVAGVNLSSWFLARIWPAWTNLAAGYEVRVVKR